MSSDPLRVTSTDIAQDHTDGILNHQITLRYDSAEWPAATIAIASTNDKNQVQARYRISGEIGRGGMGAIMRVVDRTLNRPVAMKVMLAERNDQVRMRFIEEAQITGQLEHPGIVPVHDIGVNDRGRLFFTMKLVNGVSLAEVIRRLNSGDQTVLRQFSLLKLLKILVDVCHAVAFAHHRGVIHRDLKPDNIMVGHFGEVQVMDWGLAKVLTGSIGTPQTGAQASSTTHARPLVDQEPPITSSRDEEMKTLFGTIIGTPAYMPPEQASGDHAAISMRTDIYSLGAVLYEMLTWTPPARGDTPADVVASVLSGHIDPPELRAPARAIPGELSAIAMKAMQSDPRQRYQCVEAFRADIELFLEGRAVSAKVDSAWETIGKLVRRNRGISTSIAIAIAVIVLVVAGAFAMTIRDRRNAEHEKRLALDAKADAMEGLANLRKEQAETERERVRRTAVEQRAVPGLVLQARAAVDLDHYAEATQDLDLALAIDGRLGDALLLRGQIALTQRAWSVATASLWEYVSLNPRDLDARQLLDLSRSPLSQANTPVHDAAIATIFARQGATHLAHRLTGGFDEQVEQTRRRLEHVWPGARNYLALSPNRELSFDARALRATLTDLSPLHGIPLTALNLDNSARIADLGPLRGMPLHELSLRSCSRITDYSPLSGLPLVRLDVSDSSFADLSSIATIPTLRVLTCTQNRVRNISLLATMPLTAVQLERDPQLVGLDQLRKHPTLTTINLLPAGEFWRRFDHDHLVPSGP